MLRKNILNLNATKTYYKHYKFYISITQIEVYTTLWNASMELKVSMTHIEGMQSTSQNYTF